MDQPDNKIAIVTGGARGIGFAIAERYVVEGAKVVIADVDEKAGEAGDARRLVAEACAFGGVDILVNNAGIVHSVDLLDISEADFDRVVRVNLKGAFLVGQAAARQMVAQVKAGRAPSIIINMSSINSQSTQRKWTTAR